MANISLPWSAPGSLAGEAMSSTFGGGKAGGLLSGLLSGGQKIGAGFLNTLKENPELFLALGTDLNSGTDGYGNTAKIASIIREQRAADRQKAQTMDWLKQNAPEFIAPIEAGLMSPQDAYKAKTGIGQTQSRYGNPQPFQKPDGSISYGMFGSDGTFKEIQTPEGWQPAPTMEKVDAGTHWEIYDRRSGQLINIVQKNTRDEEINKASGTEIGKGRGESQANYERMISKLPGLKKVVNELAVLADEATYTWAGRTLDEGIKQLGMKPRDAAIARAKYEAMVDNQVLPLLRETFGAQFTVEEGKSLRATLGDPNKSPEEKKAVLDAFIKQKIRNIEAAREHAGIVDSGNGMTEPESGGGVTSWDDYFKDGD